jgi:hypothetical protein
MTQPISIDRLEFIEVDGLKIRFQRNRVEGGIPVVLTSPGRRACTPTSGFGRSLAPRPPLLHSTSRALANRKVGRN